MATPPLSLSSAIAATPDRSQISAAAVDAASAAIAKRRGLSGVAAQVGMDTIKRLRPGFLERHVDAMLPALALAVDPHWRSAPDGATASYFIEQGDAIAHDLLEVTDAYVAQASDQRAIAVYQHLRSRAPRRISEHMPEIEAFIRDQIAPHDGEHR